MVFLDFSFSDFWQKHDFDYFDLILFKRLCFEISFSNFFAYLLLDHIIYIYVMYKKLGYRLQFWIAFHEIYTVGAGLLMGDPYYFWK